ncbi:ComEC/Rec2 family competence protein [Maricaulis maris]|uniref:ComEC/Rec2 family competence protein n=1 Tax=Maricaulis maris TaxID=74318 RepID=UPI003B8DF985
MLQPDAILPHSAVHKTKKSAKPVDPFVEFKPSILAALAAIIGCGLYFSVPEEPSRALFLALIALAAALALAARFSPESRKPVSRLLGITALVLGVGTAFAWRAQGHSMVHHADSGAGVHLDGGREAVTIEGWLEAIERSGSVRMRLLIRTVSADPAAPRRQRVRVLGEAGSIQPGDPIRIRAVLAAPRPAAVPGGYDFAFHAAFADIRATGFAVEAAAPGPATGQDPVARRLVRLRASLSSHIRARMAPRPGGLAAALLTGDRAHIAPRDVDALRQSGLGHVLAISGMHMALLAGGVFFAVRLLLSGLSPWARRHDAAIPAACVALVFAAGYLLLSGAGIPTQRAFIMIVSVLGAVLLRRRALSLHTLSIAVLAVLLLQPQAVITPGFQMSFSAASALIVAARVWQARRQAGSGRGVFAQIRLFVSGLGTTSLVAGSATAGFAAFHFHRIASWGLAGNLLVMPIFSLIVMPAGVIGLVLIPLGLDALPFAVMEGGLVVMLDLAARVADWPGALRPVIAAPGPILGLFASGFVLALLLRGRARLAGGAIMLAAGLCWGLVPPPNLLISESGVVLAQIESGQWVVSDRRRSRFAARVFLEARGEPGVQPERWDAQCDGLGCGHEIEGIRLTVLERLDDWPTDCARADLIITRLSVPQRIAERCTAELIDASLLTRHGSQVLHLDDGLIRSRHRARPLHQTRPWSG